MIIALIILVIPEVLEAKLMACKVQNMAKIFKLSVPQFLLLKSCGKRDLLIINTS